MLRIRDGITNVEQINGLKDTGLPVAYVGMWSEPVPRARPTPCFGIWVTIFPLCPTSARVAWCWAQRSRPFSLTPWRFRGLPVECPVDQMNMGDVIIIKHAGVVENEAGEVISEFSLKTQVLLDEVKAGGRIPLIIGRSLTERAREALGLGPAKPPPSETPRTAAPVSPWRKDRRPRLRPGEGQGVRPGTYCEPRMGVGSQDTTGPMTRDELKELACLGFSADLVMQSFCHTAAYPKPVDIETQHTLPDFIKNRGGVSLRLGDGIIHSRLNRMLLPDQVGTGGDSTPASLWAFSRWLGPRGLRGCPGVMPLDMPNPYW